MINIQYEFDPNIDTPSEKISTEIISSVLMEEGKTLAEILVIFTSDEILSDLKKEFFNKDHLTDVISFRMNDYNEEKVEGEIYISIPQVERNARKFNQSFSKELSRIIIHGSLHLLNYDDSTIDSKITMTEKENYFLKKTNWKNLV
tara:strand:+ start:847 stop:1284 length:438 start_codon:yes stop_codon:yes gene_type:complete